MRHSLITRLPYCLAHSISSRLHSATPVFPQLGIPFRPGHGIQIFNACWDLQGFRLLRATKLNLGYRRTGRIGIRLIVRLCRVAHHADIQTKEDARCNAEQVREDILGLEGMAWKIHSKELKC